MQKAHKDVTAEREQTKHVRPQNKSQQSIKNQYIFIDIFI